MSKTLVGVGKNIVGFHDGWFFGAKSSKVATTTVWCMNLDGSEFELIIPRCKAVRLSDFTGFNTILNICVFEAGVCPKSLIASVFFLDEKRDVGIVNRRYEEFTSCGQTLFCIETSDGCQFLAIFNGNFDDVTIMAARS